LIFLFIPLDAHHSLARLASTSLLNYEKRNVKDEMENVAVLNREAMGSRNWTAAHVRLGEMQVCRVVLFFGSAVSSFTSC
jgi:hypothetical protein